MTPTIAPDPQYGFLRLTPYPGEEELNNFYRHDYYHLLKSGGRAPDLARLLAGGEEARKEAQWLREAGWPPVARLLAEKAPGRRLLDFGCGIGNFVQYMGECGWQCAGVEPSEEALAAGRALGLDVVPRLSDLGAREFDAAVLINVLEHTPNPAAILQDLLARLVPGGVVMVRVPNDFSPLQLAAHEKVQGRQWWVAMPDHVNYFNFASLESFLQQLGLEPYARYTDFPMEMFLLMGDVYVDQPAVGHACHTRRRNFDVSLPDETRFAFYTALAQAGMGRACFVFARKP